MLTQLKWRHWVAIAGGVAALSATLWYLTREEAGEADAISNDENRKKKIDLSSFTRDDMVALLTKIQDSQAKVKAAMTELAKEYLKRSSSFDEVYQQMVAKKCNDPVDDAGLSAADFDKLLEVYQNDDGVRELLSKILGAPAQSAMSSVVTSLTKAKIIQLHEFMVEELKKVEQEFSEKQDKGNYDPKVVTLTAQIIVAAKTEQKFGISSEDLEDAVMFHHEALVMDPQFSDINAQLQATMSQLLSHRFYDGTMRSAAYDL